MRASRWGLLVCGLASSCGGDDAVPFDSIAKDKPLIALDSGERQGACNWASDLARQKLNPGGKPLTCNGNALSVSSCSFPSAAQTRCTATVGQWAQCMPAFFDQIAQDPCRVLTLAFSQTELESFVNAIPGCDGIGPCAYTIMQ